MAGFSTVTSRGLPIFSVKEWSVYGTDFSANRFHPTPLYKLQAGVAKLNEAKALVDELNRKAEEQGILLKTKQDEADAALQEITVSMQVKVQEVAKVCNFILSCALTE